MRATHTTLATVLVLASCGKSTTSSVPPGGTADAGVPDYGTIIDIIDATAPFFDVQLNIPDGAFNFLDAGVPFDGAIPRTVVEVTDVTLSMNLQPPRAQDPIVVTAQLAYDNYGTMAEEISVIQSSITCAGGTFFQSFNMTPVHSAPPGHSTGTVTKVAGTASINVLFPDLLCDGMCSAQMLLNTTQPVGRLATMRCTR